jgi:hypothetical protein
MEVVVVQIRAIFWGFTHHVVKVCSDSLEKSTVSIFRVTTGPGRCWSDAMEEYMLVKYKLLRKSWPITAMRGDVYHSHPPTWTSSTYGPEKGHSLNIQYLLAYMKALFPLLHSTHVTGQNSIQTSYTTNTSSSQLLKYVNMYNWQIQISDDGQIQSLIRDGSQHCKNINFRAKQTLGHKHTDGLDTKKEWLIDHHP